MAEGEGELVASEARCNDASLACKATCFVLYRAIPWWLEDEGVGSGMPTPAQSQRLPWLSILVALACVAIALISLSRSSPSKAVILAREQRRRDLDALGIEEEGAFDLLAKDLSPLGQGISRRPSVDTRDAGHAAREGKHQPSSSSSAAPGLVSGDGSSAESVSTCPDPAQTAADVELKHAPDAAARPESASLPEEESEDENEEEEEDAPLGMCAAAAAELVQCTLKSGGWSGQVLVQNAVQARSVTWERCAGEATGQLP